MRLLITLILLLTFNTHANIRGPAAKLVIVIDDVGNEMTDADVFSLPNEVAVAILPDTPYAQHFGWVAQQTSRDVVIHMPMESLSHHDNEIQQLDTNLTPRGINAHLESARQKLPFAIALNNHKGSKLTQLTTPMTAVMKFAKRNNLAFIDSRTTRFSRAGTIAKQYSVNNLERDIFIDNQLTVEAMTKQLDNLIMLAKQNQIALGIAHPHPESVSFLKAMLPNLAKEGIQLVSLSDALHLKKAINRVN